MSEKSASAQIVCPILGMHRSGTSMVTRAFNLLGVQLGTDLQPAAKSNKMGFWEHRLFQFLNMEILRMFKINPDGYDMYPLLLGLQRKLKGFQMPAEFEVKLHNQLHKTFPYDCWGWKDPRTVLVFTYWRSFLKRCGYTDIRPIVVFRHPLACMQSLVRRGDLVRVAKTLGIPSVENFALSLWGAYNQILLATVPDGLYLCQEDLLNAERQAQQLHRMSVYIGADRSKEAEIKKWINPKMDHRQTGLNDLPKRITQIHNALLQRVAEQQRQFVVRPI